MRNLRLFIIVFALILTPLGLGQLAYAGRDHEPPAQREASAWHSSEHARVRLFRGGMNDEGQDLVGLEFELDEGWHTYWRSPGRLGLPPTFNWEGSVNVRGVTVRWPLPQYIAFEDYETYGYEGRLVLPLEISRENPDEPASLQLAIGYAMCETVCIPTLGFVAMNLPSGDRAARARPEYVWAIEEALALVPTRDLAAAGIEIEPALFVHSIAATRALRIHVSSETPFENPHIIIEGPKGLRFGQAKLALDSTGRYLEALISITRTAGRPMPFGQGLTITVIGGNRPVQAALRIAISGDADWYDESAMDAGPPMPTDHDGSRPDGQGPPR